MEDDDIFSDADSTYSNAEFDLEEWDRVFNEFERNLLDAELEGQIQYEADLAANIEEEIVIPEHIENFFGGDEIGARLDDVQLEAAIEMENDNIIEHEQDQDNFEDERR
ncbi:hypothetical protein BG003_000847, partial [Podila horticola]